MLDVFDALDINRVAWWTALKESFEEWLIDVLGLMFSIR
jgi:hypothetical protein